MGLSIISKPFILLPFLKQELLIAYCRDNFDEPDYHQVLNLFEHNQFASVEALIDPITKLTYCAIIPASALYGALKIQSFPFSSLFIGVCDALIVLTMAVARTKVQLMAKQFYPNFLASIIAARCIIIKAATLFSVGICLLMSEWLSLQTTLMLFALPIGLSFLPLFLDAPKRAPINISSIKLIK